MICAAAGGRLASRETDGNVCVMGGVRETHGKVCVRGWVEAGGKRASRERERDAWNNLRGDRWQRERTESGEMGGSGREACLGRDSRDGDRAWVAGGKRASRERLMGKCVSGDGGQREGSVN